VHIPGFPPTWEDFRPGNPYRGEPPLPHFLMNPWLAPPERERLVKAYGEWATARAEAMIPEEAGVPAAEKAAASMLEALRYRYGIPVPTPPRTARRRPRARA